MFFFRELVHMYRPQPHTWRWPWRNPFCWGSHCRTSRRTWRPWRDKLQMWLWLRTWTIVCFSIPLQTWIRPCLRCDELRHPNGAIKIEIWLLILITSTSQISPHLKRSSNRIINLYSFQRHAQSQAFCLLQHHQINPLLLIDLMQGTTSLPEFS